MIFVINNVGELGVIRDKLPHELAPNAWSSGENVRFVDGYAQKAEGYSQVFGALPLAVYRLLPVPQTINYVWLEMGLSKVYVWGGASHTNLTRQTAEVDVNYTGGAGSLWTGCVLGGVPVINNGVDPPQQWLPATTGTKLKALDNWPTGLTAKSLRAYKQFLVALAINEGATFKPTTLKWSHPADPGTVPNSWSASDLTKDSGEYTFADTGDFLVDCVTLRDMNIVYKESSTWSMQFIGGIDVFRFAKLFGNFGALSVDCAVEYFSGKHLVLTQGDVIVHDGLTHESILSGKWKKWLVSSLNPAAIKTAYVTASTQLEEVYICVATGSATQPNEMLIWNWSTGTIGHRYIPGLAHTTQGIVDTSILSDSWQDDVATWNSDTSSWIYRNYNALSFATLGCSPADSKLYQFKDNTTANGIAFTTTLERTGLSVPFQQERLPDFTSMKFLTSFWPRIEGTAGGVVDVFIGTQQIIGGAVTWKASKPYTIGSSKKINTTASGRLFALKLVSNTALEWRLHGYELDVGFAGRF